jgi:sulfur carrier protein ThiS
MKLRVELQAYLEQYAPDERGTLDYDLADGATVAQLLRKLGVPDELASVIIVSGEATSMDHVLANGDQVTLVPPLAGG